MSEPLDIGAIEARASRDMDRDGKPAAGASPEQTLALVARVRELEARAARTQDRHEKLREEFSAIFETLERERERSEKAEDSLFSEQERVRELEKERAATFEVLGVTPPGVAGSLPALARITVASMKGSVDRERERAERVEAALAACEARETERYKAEVLALANEAGFAREREERAETAEARVRELEEALVTTRSVISELADGMEHDEELCPQDDTCTCENVARVNAALAAGDDEEEAMTSTPPPPRSTASP